MRHPLSLAVLLSLSPAGIPFASDPHAHDEGHALEAPGHETHAAHDAQGAHGAPAPAKKSGKKPPAAASAPASGGHDHDAVGHDHGPGADAHAAPGNSPAAAAPELRATGDHGDPKVRILLKGAVERLKEGNRRFAEGRSTGPRRGKDQRALVARAQLPFAVVVGCADSRVPPEVLFDQGLGDLFTVRVAGNVVDDPLLGSIEYAVEHLGSRLIVVLGHERCGAVDAACKASGFGGHGADPGGHVGSLVKAIRPAVEVARRHKGQNLLADAVRANVERVVDQLKGSWPVLGPEVREGKVTVIGAIYDLDTGLVEFLP